MDLNKKHKEINKPDDTKALPNGTTNNNVFIGSTTDLQRMLNRIEDDKNVIEIDDAIDSTGSK